MAFENLSSELKNSNGLEAVPVLAVANISAFCALSTVWVVKSIPNALHGMAFVYLVMLAILNVFIWSKTLGDIAILLSEPAFFDPITTEAIYSKLYNAMIAASTLGPFSLLGCASWTILLYHKLDNFMDPRQWFLLNALVTLHIACAVAVGAAFGFNAKTMDLGNTNAVERAEDGHMVAEKLSAWVVIGVLTSLWGFITSLAGLVVVCLKRAERLRQPRALGGERDVESTSVEQVEVRLLV